MRSKILAVGIIGAAFLFGGCDELLSDFDWDGLGGDDIWVSDATSALEIVDGVVSGDLGDVVGLPGLDAQIEPGFDSADYTTFNMTSEGQEGTIMQIVEIDGGIDHPMLQEPGTTITNDCEEPRDPQVDPPMMRVTGCSTADDDGFWDYDEPCETTTVEVEEDPEGDPDVLMYTVTTDFARDQWDFDSNDTTQVISQFRVRQRAEEGQPSESADRSSINSWVSSLVNGGTR